MCSSDLVAECDHCVAIGCDVSDFFQLLSSSDQLWNEVVGVVGHWYLSCLYLACGGLWWPVVACGGLWLELGGVCGDHGERIGFGAKSGVDRPAVDGDASEIEVVNIEQ